MQKQVAAFGVYAGLQDQNIASAHRVINQIYDFIHETIMIAPHIWFQISQEPETRRVADKHGRTIYFEYYPQKEEIRCIGIYKWNLKELGK